MLFSLENKNAVIIGGAGGVGQAIAGGLIESGATVIIADRSDEIIQRGAEEIEKNTGKKPAGYVVEATSEESVVALLEAIEKDFERVDILVNAQGYNKKHAAHEFDMADFRQMLEVNVVSLMMTCKVFGGHMIKKGGGKILNVSSVRGRIATRLPGNCGYCSSKGAVDMMTRQLASEFGQYGITVNAIAPTLMETPMMSAVIEQRGGETYRNSVAETHPMKKMMVPADCIGTVVYLCSPASDYVTGTIAYVDGGLTAVG